MAKTKAVGRPRGMNPPAEGAAPRGKESRSKKQDEEYHKIIDKMLEKESSGAKFNLKLSYLRGQHAAELLKDDETYGKNSIDNIASDLGVKRLTIQQCVKFANPDIITKEQVDELCELNPPPPWRMMGKWTLISDSDARSKILGDILSGKVKSTGFEAYLASTLNSGPAVSRRPKDPGAAFRTIEAKSVVLIDYLTSWVPGAVKGVIDTEDTIKRREQKALVRSTVKRLKSMQAAIEDALEKCETVV